MLDLIADRWSVLIIGGIRAGANRNGLLLNAIDGISPRMLARVLRQFVQALCDWSIEHMHEVRETRAAHDRAAAP